MAANKQVENSDEANGRASKWLIAKYLPTTLFSLRMSHSTSSGGKTLFVPTPYAYKLALIDAAFRAEGCSMAELVFQRIKGKEIRFRPPHDLVVNHTFIKIKREPKVPTPEKPYIQTIAFREYCYFKGSLDVAIGVEGLLPEAIGQIKFLMAHINYIGKRGSFIQFCDISLHDIIPAGFSIPVPEALDVLDMNSYKVTQFLDDLGELEAKDLFERINTYSDKSMELNKHRILKQTFLPYTLKSGSKHYTHYKNEAT